MKIAALTNGIHNAQCMATRKEDKVDRMKKCDLNKIMFLAEIFEVKSEKDEIALFDAIRYLDSQEPIDSEKMRKEKNDLSLYNSYYDPIKF